MDNLIYIILAHDNPKQIERMIFALKSNYSKFYIHVDLKSDIKLFERLFSIESVTFIKNRIDCIWGDFSQVKATLNLINQVISENKNGFIILLSGKDYPIKPISYIEEYLQKSKHDIYMDIQPAHNVWKDFDKRIFDYRINIGSERGNYLILKQGLNKKNIKYFLKKQISFKEFFQITTQKRKLNLDLTFYGGSQWWAMKLSSSKNLIDFINLNWDELNNFFKFSHVPDEFFFQSIVMKICETNDLLISESLTYVNWIKPNVPLPVIFTVEDYHELNSKSENKLFARKFDTNINDEILNKIDKEILHI